MSNATTGTAEGQFVPMDAVFSGAPGSDPLAAEPLASSVGERLRDARARQGWTLDSAEARTRIKRDYLEALEAMDPRGMPSRAYAIGYLRTYARALGLDCQSVIDQFKIEVECEAGRDQPRVIKEKREIRLPKGMVGALLILASVIGAAGWYGSYVSSSEAFDQAPPSADALMSSPGPLIEELSRAPSVNEIWSGLPEPRGKTALVLRATETSFLEVRDASGRILFSRDLAAGEIYRAPDEAGLLITVENAGALLAQSAGVELGPLGEPGEAVETLSVDAILQGEALAAVGEAEAAG
ncbi:MAG: RodZ domain-containing protein [Pseudomonadota bacterium]